MLISPVRGFNLNTQNNNNVGNTKALLKTNSLMSDTVSFGTRTPRILPEDLVSSANEIIKKLKSKELQIPIENARSVLDSPYVTEEEQLKAIAILQKGVMLQSPVEINGKTQSCTANLGHYYGEWELCMDVGKDKGMTRYRVGIDFDAEKVIPSSEFKVQQHDESGNHLGFASLKDSKAYNKAVSTVKTLLDALAKV